MASGDGFAPHKGAMDTAARAAETMWWWDPSPVGTDRATNGAAPTKKSKKDSGGADGTWRTRDELVQAGSGTKAPTPAKDRARWTPWRSPNISERCQCRWKCTANRSNASQSATSI